MERTLISFNLPNVITVTIMAALGYVLLAVIAQIFQSQSGAGAVA